MDYQEFIEDIKALEFIKDEDAADAAIKAVLGMLSGSLAEESARKMAGALPEPLDIFELRGQQSGGNAVTFEQCVAEIARRFQLEKENAEVLANAILRSTRAALGGEKLGQIEEVLPESWSLAIEYA